MVNTPKIILGIESSCDETAAAIMHADKTILGEALASQVAEHRAFGGVVPEVAARAHLLHVRRLISDCLEQAEMDLGSVDAVAATCGPGLIGGVMVGAMMGKAIAASLNKPFIAVNHLAAHALSPRMVSDIAFPYLLLLVSGGHCQLIVVEGADKYRRLGTTIDDAAGEAFDKVAKLLGLGYPGGPAIEQAAAHGDASQFILPVPMQGRPEAHFSFSGLKTAVRVQLEKAGPLSPAIVSNMAASFVQAVVAAMLDRTSRALAICAELGIKPTALVAAGGVAASKPLRAGLQQLAAQQGLPFVAPPGKLCTDNAAMIAWAGHERAALGLFDTLDFAPRPRWPLDPDAESARGAGVKA